jgi:hypothetical protein
LSLEAAVVVEDLVVAVAVQVVIVKILRLLFLLELFTP